MSCFVGIDRYSKRSFACILYPLTTFVALTGSALATPLDVTGGVSTTDVSVSGELHGDLDADVLTLNSTAPRSSLSIDARAAVPGGLPFEPGTEILPATACVPIFISCVTPVTIFVTYSPTVTFALTEWDFNVGGAIDFGAGTANLTAVPKHPSILGSVVDTDTPLFDVSPNIIRLSSLLNDPGTTITTTVTGVWDSIALGTATASLDRNGSDVEANLALADSVLTGYLDVAVDVSFANPALIVQLLGGLFGTQLEGILQVAISKQLAEEVNSALDFDESGYRQDCAAGEQSSRVNGKTRRNVTCYVSADLSFSGTLPDNRVPEPATLALFGLGLAGLVIAVRRRKTH